MDALDPKLALRKIPNVDVDTDIAVDPIYLIYLRRCFTARQFAEDSIEDQHDYDERAKTDVLFLDR